MYGQKTSLHNFRVIKPGKTCNQKGKEIADAKQEAHRLLLAHCIETGERMPQGVGTYLYVDVLCKDGQSITEEPGIVAYYAD